MGEDTRENVKLAECIIIGEITKFGSKEEMLLISRNGGCPIVETLHSKKMLFVLHVSVTFSPGQSRSFSKSNFGHIIHCYIYRHHGMHAYLQLAVHLHTLRLAKKSTAACF